MDCNLCRRSQEDHKQGPVCRGIDTVAECPTGQIPKIMEGNEAFLDLFDRILPGLFDAWGGLHIDTVQTVCDLRAVPPGERPIILDKVLMCVKAIREVEDVERQKRVRQD